MWIQRMVNHSGSDHSRIGRALSMTLHLFSDNVSSILECNFAWQAQYLVRLEGDACCSAHCKWRFISHEDQSCVSFYLAQHLVSWRVMPVAPRIVNDVSYVTDITHESHFAWQVQYLVTLEDESCCSAHCKWRFICDGHHSWESFCVAGTVLGDVGGGVLLLRAL